MTITNLFSYFINSIPIFFYTCIYFSVSATVFILILFSFYAFFISIWCLCLLQIDLITVYTLTNLFFLLRFNIKYTWRASKRKNERKKKKKNVPCICYFLVYIYFISFHFISFAVCNFFSPYFGPKYCMIFLMLHSSFTYYFYCTYYGYGVINMMLVLMIMIMMMMSNENYNKMLIV